MINLNLPLPLKDLITAVRSVRRRTLRKVVRRRMPRHHRVKHRGYAVQEFDRIYNDEPSLFKRMFRMSPSAFSELVDNLDLKLARNEVKAAASSGECISDLTNIYCKELTDQLIRWRYKHASTLGGDASLAGRS